MDEAIPMWVESCQACQESQPTPRAALDNSWERVHINLAGLFYSRIFMVVVDTYSKWLEVALMSSTTSETFI